MPTVTIGENTGDDYSGCEDTLCNIFAPTNDYSASSSIYMGRNETWNTFIKFSGLSNISSSASVSDASLFLYEFNGDNGYNIDVRRFLRDWIDNEANYNVWTTGNNWTTSGGIGDGTDRVAALSAQGTSSSTDGWRELTDTTLISDIQDEIDGTNNIRGWHISNDQSASYRVDFRSSEGTDTQRPYLSVTYTTGPTYYDYSFTESLNASDTKTETPVFAESFSEITNGADSNTGTNVAVESLAESSVAVESLTDLVLLLEQLSEAGKASDTGITQFVFIDEFSETAISSESIDSILIYIESLSDASKTSDTASGTYLVYAESPIAVVIQTRKSGVEIEAKNITTFITTKKPTYTIGAK